MLIAMPMTKSSPQDLRIAARSSAEKRMRFSKLPPYLVVAPIAEGRPELLDQRVVGRHQLAAVESGILARRAQRRSWR